MAFPKYVSKTKPVAAPVQTEPTIARKIWDWFSEPAIDSFSGGKEFREKLTTANLDEATDNDEYQWAPFGLPVGTAVGMVLKPSMAKTKAFIGGGLEGVTPANIAEAVTLKGSGRVVKEGVKAAGGFGKFLTNRTTTKKLIEKVPEYKKALENTSKIGSSGAGLTANALLGGQGGYNALLNDENTTTDKVLGAVQAVGGAAGFGMGLASRSTRPKAPKLEVVQGADMHMDAMNNRPNPLSVDRTHKQPYVDPGKATDSPRVQKIVAKNDKEADKVLGQVIKDKVDTEKAHTKAVTDAAKEVEKEGVQQTRNDNARRKYIKEQLLQDTRNENAVSKFTDKRTKEEQKGLADLEKIIGQFMDDADKRIADAAAKKAVEDALTDLKPQDPSVTIRSTDKSVPGETRSVSQRFTKPAPEKPEGGGGDGTVPFDPDLDGPDANPGLQQSIIVVDPSSTGPSRPLPKNVNLIQRDLKKARAIAQNYGMGIKQNPDGLYELIPKEANSPAAPTGILTDDIFKTHLEASGAQKKVGGKIIGSAKSGFKVVGPEDPNPPYNPNDKNSWIDLGGNGPDDLPPSPPPAPAPVPAGPKPKGGSPKSGMRVAGPKAGKTVKNILEDYSPEELAELDQIIDEMASQPHNSRSWNWDLGENEVGNAAGGKAIIQAGNAGAPVYHELLKFLSGLPETQGGPSRGQILDALTNFRKGSNNVWGRRAIEVAKQRIAKRNEPARLDEWVKAEEGRSAAANVEGPKDPTISSPPDTGEDTINSLLKIAQDSGYKGDLQTLKAKLVAQLDGLDPSFGKFLQESGSNWWDELDTLSNQSDEVVDTLPTGEAQPRLPDDVGQVRDVENPNPEMEVPLSLTPDVAEGPEGVTGSLFAPDDLPSNPQTSPVKVDSGAALIDMMNAVPETPTAPQGVIPVAALKKSKFDLLGEQQRTLQAEGKAAGEKLPRDIKNHPTSTLSDAPRLQGARIAGRGLDRLSKNAKIEEENARLLAMSPDELKAWYESQKGFAANELGIRAGLGIAGGLTGGAVAEENDIDPALGMLAGGAAGFMSPSAAKALVEAANASGDSRVIQAATAKAKEAFNQALQLVPDYVRASLLFNFPNIFINSWVGPYGSAVMGALETLIANPTDPVPLAALKNLANPKKLVTAYGRNWKLAGDVIEQANNRGESSQALEKAPRIVRRILSTPGQFMTAGDLAAKDMLTDAGISVAKSRGMTLTDEPEMGWARMIREGVRAAQTEGGKKSIIARMALPFHKTVINQAEGTLERIPFIGILANKAKDTADPANLQAAQQLLGGGVLAGMFLAGASSPYGPTDPENLILMKVISNAGGQYGMLAVGAYSAGQIYANGATIREAAEKFGSSLLNNVPLPTTRPLKELGDLGLDSAEVLVGERSLEDITVPRSIWPQGLRPEPIRESVNDTGRLLKKGTDSLGITEPAEEIEESGVGIFGSRIR